MRAEGGAYSPANTHKTAAGPLSWEFWPLLYVFTRRLPALLE